MFLDCGYDCATIFLHTCQRTSAITCKLFLTKPWPWLPVTAFHTVWIEFEIQLSGCAAATFYSISGIQWIVHQHRVFLCSLNSLAYYRYPLSSQIFIINPVLFVNATPSLRPQFESYMINTLYRRISLLKHCIIIMIKVPALQTVAEGAARWHDANCGYLFGIREIIMH